MTITTNDRIPTIDVDLHIDLCQGFSTNDDSGSDSARRKQQRTADDVGIA